MRIQAMGGIAGRGPVPEGALATDDSEPPTRGCSEGLRMVNLGDGFASGVQDGVTLEARQRKVYVKQLADHAGVSFNMPYLSGQGIPFGPFQGEDADSGQNQRQLLKLGVAVAPLALYTHFVGAPNWVVPVWEAVPDFGKRTSESRDTPENPQSSFAMAGHELRHLQATQTMNDYLQEVHQGLEGLPSLTQEVPLIRATLGNGKTAGNGSQAEQAIAKDPHLAVIWAGNSDALAGILSGRIDDAVLTPTEDRQWVYQVTNPITGQTRTRVDEGPREGFRSQLLGPYGLVGRMLRDTRAEIMLLNIPDVQVIPLLREVGKPVGDLPFRVVLKNGEDVTEELEAMIIPDQVAGAGSGGRTQFPAGTRVNLAVLVQKLTSTKAPRNREDLAARIASQDALLGEDDVLDPDELGTISSRIASYNASIEEAASLDPRVHVVDIHSAFNLACQEGRPLRGQGEDLVVGTGMTGALDERGREGLFSYDGVHPSDTGHAVVANLVLDKIQSDLAAHPEFGAFQNLSPIDEKAVYYSDPHTSEQAVVVLDEASIDLWARGGRI
ncbi:SGNH/GDSL hydrolase family protein [bacterium CPR1]|nr:SGNH/GDSL hydrolase family protein [bacterium CPR1]